jgi:ribosomal protein S18 acetylase RimI-like enzyme
MEGLEVVDLRRADRREAAMVLAEAFLQDPAWVAIGPPDGPARRRLLLRFFRVALFETRHWGGPAWAATRGGAIVGVAVTFGPGKAFPSPLASVLEAPLFLLAGGRTPQRATQVGAAMARAHPRGAQVYLWFLAVRPAHQRSGVGRALMRRVLREATDADVPVYLETASPENIAYYRSFGFEVVGEATLPGGGRMWFMSRPAPDEPFRA